jgi:hypothetical protein
MGAAELLMGPPVEPRLDRVAVENARLLREARDRLLTTAGAVTIEMLAEGRASTEGAARGWLHRKRVAGRLVAVEHDNRTLVPTFQLDDAFDIDTIVADAVERLTAFGMGPWAVWRWFYATNGWIGQPPVEAATRGDDAQLDRALTGLIGT